MGSMLRPIPILFACLLLAPSAAAETSTWAFEFASPSVLVVRVDAVLEGEAASGIRGQIDAFGDSNGVVVKNEVDAFIVSAVQFLDSFGPSAVSGAGFLVDGKAPDGLAVKDLAIGDATGDVDSESPLRVHLVADVTFPIRGGERHTLTVEPSEAEGDQMFEASIDQATLKAPRNYKIESTQGIPEGAKVSDDEKSINFAGSFMSAESMSVVLVRTAEGSSPGTALVGALGALALVAFGWRRRPFG